MSDGTGAANAEQAVRELRWKWEQTARVWRDEAALRFQAEQIRELEGWGEAARRLAESVERLLASAWKQAP